MSDDKIIRRYYTRGILRAVSPLIIGSGETNYSENDLVRNWKGEIFIPGTAIVGAIRSYLFNNIMNDSLDKEDEDEIVKIVFGNSEIRDEIEQEENEEVYQSLIIFYDAYLNDKVDISIRDGVTLEKFTKVAEEGKKFDYEIVEPGVTFDFKLELIVYEKHENDGLINQIEDLLHVILNSFENNKIAIGAKTSRGFGQVKLDEDVKILRIIMSDNADLWLNFNWDNFEGNLKLEDLNHQIVSKSLKIIPTIEIEFKIPYSLLIRSYNPLPGELDIIPLTSNKRQIIPGTSWTGAIRNAINNVAIAMREQVRDQNKLHIVIDNWIKEIFGYVDEESIDEDEIAARKSRLIVHESLIDENDVLQYTRTKIDRFIGGVVQKALFTEGFSEGGKVKLLLEMKDSKSYEIGLILLAIGEFWYGLQPIGGTTNIGRGILEGLQISLKNTEKEFTYVAMDQNPNDDFFKNEEVQYYTTMFLNELKKNVEFIEK